MTYPRSHTVNPTVSGTYLCTSRCVRRAWLCGEDELTQRCYDHRKDWIEDRALGLTQVYAMSITSFAVLSNHYHLVVTTHPEQVATWSDTEVASRWVSLSASLDEAARQRKVEAILQSPQRLKTLRERLGSLSWYMGSINETIARRANKEDECSGRFWEGRFDCQGLLDDAAVTAAMVYVDLNPVRAGMVDAPDKAEHTSLARRLRASPKDPQLLADLQAMRLTLSAYLALLHWTVRADAGTAHSLEQPSAVTLPCRAEDNRTDTGGAGAVAGPLCSPSPNRSVNGGFGAVGTPLLRRRRSPMLDA
jgi:REP element-mobilizing transposase RayT